MAKNFGRTTCLTCKTDFQKTGPRSAYCSQECKPDLYTHTCETCGSTFGSRKAKTARFCSDECAKPFYAEMGKVNGKKYRVSEGGDGFHPNAPDAIRNTPYGEPRSWSYDRGYIYYYWPEHPGAGATLGRIHEHRVVGWELWGDKIIGHHVDHINGIKTDNRPENLQCLSAAAHASKTARHDGPSGFWNWTKEHHPWLIQEWKNETAPGEPGAESGGN